MEEQISGKYITIMFVSATFILFGSLAASDIWGANIKVEEEKTKQLELQLKIETLKHKRDLEGK